MKNETKYEMNNDGKYDIFYRGFDYMTFLCHDWKKIRTVESENEARTVCSDCLDFGDPA